MKLIMILVASLLPFLHETRYPAEVKGCDAQGITLSAEGELFHAELFNVTYAEEDGWQDACAILAEADEVSFEVDPLVSLEEPLPVYLFADGEMVQERLLQEGKAVLSIRNPNYRYEQQLEAAEPPLQTMADTQSAQDDRSLPVRSYLGRAAHLGSLVLAAGLETSFPPLTNALQFMPVNDMIRTRIDGDHHGGIIIR